MAVALRLGLMGAAAAVFVVAHSLEASSGTVLPSPGPTVGGRSPAAPAKPPRNEVAPPPSSPSAAGPERESREPGPSATSSARRQVPRVLGRTSDHALAIISERGFAAHVIEQEADGRTPGVVIDQRPEPGERLAPGGTVTIVVATESASAAPSTEPTTTATSEPPPGG